MIGRLALALAWLAAPAAAQRLADRIGAAPDGIVRVSFAARAGVCGDGRNGTWGRQTVWHDRSDADEVAYDCEAGPVRVSLTVRRGHVEALRTYVGGRWVTPPAAAAVTDLGTIATRAAADFLLDLAAREDGRVGEEAILPATLADSVTVWPTLLTLAKSDRVPRRARRQAVFWLGQAAGSVATRGLSGLVDEDGVEREVKEQAVFALSQQPHGDGVPALIRIARTHADRELRRKALFWLGQSDDPRALALFEELLTHP